MRRCNGKTFRRNGKRDGLITCNFNYYIVHHLRGIDIRCIIFSIAERDQQIVVCGDNRCNIFILLLCLQCEVKCTAGRIIVCSLPVCHISDARRHFRECNGKAGRRDLNRIIRFLQDIPVSIFALLGGWRQCPAVCRNNRRYDSVKFICQQGETEHAVAGHMT
ncbi:hypothetical protein Barb6_00449 [Bacteroidales bacterium Barb6]|nr:hypothetical protein Barb6_00449 [Bacteroidales bacterium Barb6]